MFRSNYALTDFRHVDTAIQFPHRQSRMSDFVLIPSLYASRSCCRYSGRPHSKLRSLFVSRSPLSISISIETSSAFAIFYTVSAEHFSSFVFPLQMSFSVSCGTPAAIASRYFVMFLLSSKSSMITFLHLAYPYYIDIPK